MYNEEKTSSLISELLREHPELRPMLQNDGRKQRNMRAFLKLFEGNHKDVSPKFRYLIIDHSINLNGDLFIRIKHYKNGDEILFSVSGLSLSLSYSNFYMFRTKIQNTVKIQNKDSEDDKIFAKKAIQRILFSEYF